MSRGKSALITGITGQDGSYLAEYLLDRGYSVHGILRQVEADDPRWFARLADFKDSVTLHVAEFDRFETIQRAVADAAPSECYHLAAQSFVSYSVSEEAATLGANIGGTQALLSALWITVPECRFFFASSSELFGRTQVSPQTEDTPVCPRSVYGITKAAGHFLTGHYRETHGMHAACGILYNHESPRRGTQFVTRKITMAAARIAAGSREKLRLGNLDSTRDWGHARDYVCAMWLMLQKSPPSDYIVATGTGHSVRDFCRLAFRRVGLNYEDWVESDPSLYRSAETAPLVGNPSKATADLNWRAPTPFEDIVCEMVDHDCLLAGVDIRRRQCA